MGHATWITIDIIGNDLEHNEIERAIVNELIDVPMLYDGPFHRDGIISLTAGRIPFFECNFMDDLMESYPTVLFKYQEEQESISGTTRKVLFTKSIRKNSIEKIEKDVNAHYSEMFLKNTHEKSKGLNFELVLYPDSTVGAYGYNRHGECAVSAWQNIVQISTGFNHSLGLDKDGLVYATGSNGNGQVDLTENNKKVVDISCGKYHSSLLYEDGSVEVFGGIYRDYISVFNRYNGRKRAQKREVDPNEKDFIYSSWDQWPKVKKIKSVLDAVYGITEAGTIYYDGYSYISEEQIREYFESE